MWRAAFICVALIACTPANAPTRTDTLFYDHFQTMLPARFAGAAKSLDWRGFNFAWRFQGVTTQCGARVFDLPRDAAVTFAREIDSGAAPEAASNPATTGWTPIGRARSAPIEWSSDLQAQWARNDVPLASAEGFCAMPEAAHSSFAARAAALWANDDTIFLVQEVHFGGGAGPGGDRVQAHYYALLDEAQNQLYVWFYAAPPVG